jgi:hypothetical protein
MEFAEELITESPSHAVGLETGGRRRVEKSLQREVVSIPHGGLGTTKLTTSQDKHQRHHPTQWA